MRPFDYFAPETLDEAISILRRRGDDGRLLAGGTDLVVRMKEGGLRPSYVVSLRKLSELRGIEFSEAEGLRIGAMTDMATIASSPIIRERFPILADGAALVGSVQTRNMATVGGNLCNAAPSADMAPPLLALDAVARIAGARGVGEPSIVATSAAIGNAIYDAIGVRVCEAPITAERILRAAGRIRD